MRATLADVAMAAGVSNATVDRVLNGRVGVRGRTRDLVLEAARMLGYIQGDGSETAAQGDKLQLDFILPAGANAFMAKLAAELQTQAAQKTDLTVRLHLVEGFNPDTLASELEKFEGKAGGIGLVAIDHPNIRDAIRRLARSGVPIVTLVSDVQHVPRVGYVGIDNRTAGRLAGYLMLRFLGAVQNKVAVFAGSLSYRGHEEREMGFRNIVAEHADRLEIVSFSEVRDDDEQAYRVTRDHLARHPDLAAIYNIGAGNRGVARALEEAGRADSIVFIGHDLTEDTKQYLLNDTMDAVIDQYPRVEAREALEQLSRAARGLPWSAHPLRTQIILKENLPDDFF